MPRSQQGDLEPIFGLGRRTLVGYPVRVGYCTAVGHVKAAVAVPGQMLQ